MNKKLKQKWVSALRSGKFEQCHNILSDGRGYCCLGVLAKIQGLPLIDDSIGLQQGSYRALAKLIGTDNEGLRSLTIRNDGEAGHDPHTFDQMADYIEANF